MDMMTRRSALRILPDRVRLPNEVQLLLKREREIATIVYRLRAATAEDVCENVSAPLANASVRSMLNRLVAKDILKRTLSGRAFIYLPALTCSDSGIRALRQFAQDYFGGSISQAAEAVQAMLGSRDAPAAKLRGSRLPRFNPLGHPGSNSQHFNFSSAAEKPPGPRPAGHGNG
jgi:predicted transcriptional regulator